ncbi:hypothetical protein FOZ61_009217 [Perkinsus olseni]|uniref:Uncharacterized protein n=1 Tax=Perkinsus olseni TaxID=32597 RepID=A0A7J6M6T0_PEROL|nr:hypothetical protein FOZ61_009217 [Perkinsus olseni]KAF4671873.1 hypothetical protein FOL46_009780 [Perkinsus olseni]
MIPYSAPWHSGRVGTLLLFGTSIADSHLQDLSYPTVECATSEFGFYYEGIDAHFGLLRKEGVQRFQLTEQDTCDDMTLKPVGGPVSEDISGVAFITPGDFGRSPGLWFTAPTAQGCFFRFLVASSDSAQFI